MSEPLIATAPQRIDALAVRLCQVLRDVRREAPAWIAIDRLNEQLGLDNPGAVDAAVAFAGAKGWLAIAGRPAHSLLLKDGAP